MPICYLLQEFLHISASACRSDLEAVISEILETISSHKTSEPSSISVFLDAANFTKDNEGSPEKSMSFEDFRNWSHLVPSARKFLTKLLKPSSSGIHSSFHYDALLFALHVSTHKIFPQALKFLN